MTTQPEQFEGLKWVDDLFSLEPLWTTDPDIERIREVVQRVLPSELRSQQEVTITLFSQGTFNKVYTIRIGEKELIMRVTLPVDPRWKTLSEVATVGWVCRNTHLAVPEIIAHDASRDNSIGFEWILMLKLPGRPLNDVWTSMDFAAKKQLTHEVAVFCSSMFKKQLRGIGNLYPVSKLEEFGDSDLPEVQRIVSWDFFWGDHISQPVPRGPFRSSRDWLEARLLFCEHDCHSTIARHSDKPDLYSDEYDAVKPYETLHVISRLKLLLDDLFPSSEVGSAEPSILFHDDLAQRNMLVDEAGVLTGVVDWECVSALPLWKACDYPKFLQGPSRHVTPVQAESESEDDEVFWLEMVWYDTTILRKYFLEEMRRLEPGWVKVFQTSELQRGFDKAVQNCSNYFRKPNIIHAWINDVLLGKENMHSLSDTACSDMLTNNVLRSALDNCQLSNSRNVPPCEHKFCVGIEKFKLT